MSLFNQNEKLILVAYNPAQRFFARLLLAISLVVIAAGGYLYGYHYSSEQIASTLTERKHFRLLAHDQKEELSNLRRQALVMESNHAIDQQSYQETLQSALNLQARINQLEYELLFYQQLFVLDD